MVDGHIELGGNDKAAPTEMPPRRRLFEGGSGVIPSSLSHKSPLNLQREASSVREQAASLSSRAVIEGIKETPCESLQEEDEREETADSIIDSQTIDTGDMLDADYSNVTGDFLGVNVPESSNSILPHISPCSDRIEHVVDGNMDSEEEKFTLKRMVSYFPAVLVGTLLNILDGLSYGMILFPLGVYPFAGLESAGLSLFYTSTIIAQLVFSLGGSGFKSCVGSEMIEIVPFFHAIAIDISRKLVNHPKEDIIATTMTAFAVSAVITGMTFFLLGWLRLGALVGFFPLHILLGCIGGVGWFLIATGFEVSARLEGGVEYNLATLQFLFSDFKKVAQWGSCLALGGVLMYAERRLHHPLVVPSILVATFVLFHAVIALVPQLTLDAVRDHGWLFPAQEAGEPWYWIYTLYKPSYIHIKPILECLPVMLALNFFGIIHVPINIPALAAAIKEDSFNVNRELISHGISNTLSGFCGSIQNYLVYTNSVMFIKSGADSPLAGVMLAGATTVMMLCGPSIIGYIPVIVVGSLIFMMGFDLVAEALVDTYGSVRKQDYATMLAITLIMGCYDFVVGIFAGIVLACLFFVINSARRSPIMSQMSGTHAHSTVIRHPLLQQYLRNVGRQIYIMRLSGALFFGTNGTLEREVRGICDCTVNGGFASIKYLILDLENVTDIDYCTVDTFLRLKRLLDSCRIRMVLSGAETAGHKIRGLKAVDLVPEEIDHNDPLSVRVFATLNIALSWCENQFIKEYYLHGAQHMGRKQIHHHIMRTMPASVPGISKWGMNQFGIEGSPTDEGLAITTLGTTPRSSYIKTQARRVVNKDVSIANKWKSHQEPVALLMQIIEPISSKNVDFWSRLAPFFKPKLLQTGESLPGGFHLIESGILHIQFSSGYHETALAGTAVGELTPMMKRESEIRTESETKVWTLDHAAVDNLKGVDGGFEMLAELSDVYLSLLSQRYSSMTEYYCIASNRK